VNSSVRWTLLALLAGLVVASVYWFWVPDDRELRQDEPLPEDTVTLYFLNENTYKLQSVERNVPEAKDQSHRVQQIIEQLTKEPDRAPLIRLLPGELSLRSTYLDGETVYLDFNEHLIGAARGSSGEMMLLYSIVNSVLTNLPSRYALVQFLIQGEVRKTIGPYGEESGHIAVQYPLGPRWNLADTSP